MGEDVDIRVGDAERAEARALLDEHLSAGRLTIAEHEERHALAGAARTRGDIEALFEDLPLPHPDLSSAARPPGTPQRPDEGPVSRVMGWVFCLSLIVGLPLAIALTVTNGWWWLLVVAGVLVVGSVAVGASTDKSQIER